MSQKASSATPSLGGKYLVTTTIYPSNKVEIKRRPSYNFASIREKSVPMSNNRSRKQLRPGHGIAKYGIHPYKGYRKNKELIAAMERAEQPLDARVCSIVCTLPSVHDQCEAWSGAVAGTYCQRLKKLGALAYQWSWEYQQRGALHLNVTVLVPNKVRPTFVRLAQPNFRRCLMNIRSRSGFDFFSDDFGCSWINDSTKPLVTCQVRKHTFSHYCAKSATKEPRRTEDGELISPARWSGSDKAANILLKTYTRRCSFPADDADHAMQIQGELQQKLVSKTSRVFPIKNTFTHQIVGSQFRIIDFNQAEDKLKNFIVPHGLKPHQRSHTKFDHPLVGINRSRVLAAAARIREKLRENRESGIRRLSIRQFCKEARCDHRTLRKVLTACGYSDLKEVWHDNRLGSDKYTQNLLVL
jgi:hypothetical protein